MDDRMNIYALPGHRVRATKKTLLSGYSPETRIKPGIYTVKETMVGSWNTDVYLEEKPGMCFNCVNFKDVKKQSDKLSEEHPDYLIYNPDEDLEDD